MKPIAPDPRILHQDPFDYCILNRRLAKRAVDESKKDWLNNAKSIKPPEGHKWVRIRFWRVGKKHSKIVAIPIPVCKNEKLLYEYVSRLYVKLYDQESR